jgi:tellurite resistance protein TehA-like permease
MGFAAGSRTADYLNAFDPRQRQALAYLSIRSHGYGFGIGLIFFAFTCLVLGYLIFKSGYFPGFWAS